MKRFFAVALVAFAFIPAFAQATLAPGKTVPKQDGTIGDKEYSWTSTDQGITLALSLSADGSTLYAAMSAPVNGWVAVGLGSGRMDKSYMVMGYDTGTKAAVSEHYGIGRNHVEANQKIMKAGKAKLTGGNTVLEFAVPAANFTKTGKIAVILATGRGADFTSMHNWFTALAVPVGK